MPAPKGSVNIGFDIRVPDLREISHVLDVEFFSSPQTYALWYEKWTHRDEVSFEGNVVGLTIFQVQPPIVGQQYVGLTLTAEVIAIGV